MFHSTAILKNLVILRSYFPQTERLFTCSILWNKKMVHTRSKSTGHRRKTKQKKQKIYSKHPVIENILLLQSGESLKNTSTKLLSEDFHNIIHLLETNRSQVLGFNVDEFRKRIDLFCASDIAITDAITLALSIPSPLHINSSNFKKILKILRCRELPTETIIFKHPYVAGVDHRQVERNLDLLDELEIPKGILRELLILNPLLLIYPLNKLSLEKLQKSSFSFDLSNTVVQNLKISLEEPAVENENIRKLFETSSNLNLGINIDVIEFLSSYDVDWKKVYLDCPELLLASKETIELCTDRIVSAPFYFGLEDLEKLLGSYPGVFLSFRQDNVLRMVNYLETVAITKNHLYRLLNQYPEIFEDPEMFFQRVELFEQFNFTKKDIGLLLGQKGGTNCFLECEDFSNASLSEILDCYLKGNDVNIPQIVFSAPVSLSVKFQDTIKFRMWYLRSTGKVKDLAKKRKKQQSHVTLQTVIKSSVSKFAEHICKQTMEHYNQSLASYKGKI